jgi:hypothetical protein
MVSLISLPTELLCQIVDDIHDASESSNDLFNILIVARRFSRIAIDALYRAPRLLKPNPTDPLSWHDRRAHQLPGLLKLVINRPDLANQIQKLDLTVIYDRVPGNSWPKPQTIEQVGSSTIYHWPDINERRLAIPGLDLDSKSVQSVPNMRDEWKHNAHAGFEPAIAGLLIALTPSLVHLTTNVYHALKPNDPPQNSQAPPQLNFQPEHPRGIDWWGRHVSFTSSVVAGLSHARSLRCTTSLVPWRIIHTSTLEALDVKLPHGDVSFPLRIHGAQGHRQAAFLTHLTIRADCEIMQDPEKSEEWYLARLMRRCPALRVLRILIDGKLGDRLGSAYEHAFAHAEAPNLERLVIDARGVENISEISGKVGLSIRPVTAPLKMRFPGLRRVVGMPGTFGSGALQGGIEVVEFDALPVRIKK